LISSIVGSDLFRSCRGQTDRSRLYIRARYAFVISTYLYIQNRNSFVISKTLHLPNGGYSAPQKRALTLFPICIYVPGSPSPSINVCIYRTATYLLSANRRYSTRPLDPLTQHRPGTSQLQARPQPAPSRARALPGIIPTIAERYLCPAFQDRIAAVDWCAGRVTDRIRLAGYRVAAG
jgi:hypothetical protein